MVNSFAMMTERKLTQKLVENGKVLGKLSIRLRIHKDDVVKAIGDAENLKKQVADQDSEMGKLKKLIGEKKTMI
ncbi:hypothetical protein L1987_08316 [Smallanthus sonchifolius]|uniref:Uncharacterized protein n=1 Tax=Smallanthus sonchifolius TaxID=185202 RepID=A0ACB9JLG1_9ASTR|nr:hypothetical protein L1987_08316 [Smallanthus sonchifolius]